MEMENTRGNNSSPLSPFFSGKLPGIMERIKENKFKLDKTRVSHLAAIYDNKFPCLV